jgi:hypothetical protein
MQIRTAAGKLKTSKNLFFLSLIFSVYNIQIDPNNSSAKIRSSIISAKDFTTGNLPITQLRNFDFPIHGITRKINVSFGIEDKDFSNVKFLSSGSNAAVYTGTRENKIFAIKMLKPQIKHQEVAVQEMNIEMQVLSRVEHPNIINIYGAGEKPRKFIMVEYLGGGTLDSFLRQESKNGVKGESAGLSWEDVLPIATQLASALKYLHEDFHSSAMVIHRGLSDCILRIDSLNLLFLSY